jgi:[ribosomal protein S18]-alanine N-acetyltransferase
VGSLVAHRVDTEWELENIVVAGKFRRSGFGSLLLNELIEQVRTTKGECIFLEVRESNYSARGLYEKHSFKPVGSRRGYYSNPFEDAVLYKLGL